MAQNTRKYVGVTGWAKPSDYNQVEVDRVLFRSDNELVIDVQYSGSRYTTTLKRVPTGDFRGTYSTNSRPPVQGAASCRVFTSQTGIFLFGHWYEDNQNYLWWADLEAVEKFPDEV